MRAGRQQELSTLSHVARFANVANLHGYRLSALVAGAPVVTLLYGAKDETHNQAVVLREYLLE